MDIKYTRHVYDKLKLPEVVRLKIQLTDITNVLKNPDIVDESVEPHQSIGKLTNKLSLAVIWKVEDGIIKVITFYLAERGRYEQKLFSKRK